jgi:succinate-semialdehyde dehydrogenase/glutarate-semialdehyde dehydrogenase
VCSSSRNLHISNNPTQLNDPSLLKSQTYINGQWTSAKSGKTFDVHDPATGALIGTQPEMDASDTEAAISAAAAALPSFRKLTGRERSRMLRKWYQLMMDNADDLAKLITWENGKPYADAKGEVNYAASFFEWFAEEAPRTYGKCLWKGWGWDGVLTVYTFRCYDPCFGGREPRLHDQGACWRLWFDHPVELSVSVS